MYRLFDFDGTIYDGNSTIDFYLFCLRKKISIIRFLPIFLIYAFLYKLGFKSKEQMKEKLLKFVCCFSNIDDLVLEFWNCHENKIKSFYKDSEHSHDIIISASPFFLIHPIGDKLGVYDVIASDVNSKTGKYCGLNCHGEEKVRLFKKKYKKLNVSEAYGDSIYDGPMISLASSGYYVKGDNIESWNEEKIKKKDNRFWKIICFFFLYYLIFGILMSYHHDFTNCFNLLFDADTPRVIGDFSNIFGDHYRLMVHPLIVLFIQPIILFLSGITQDKIIAILIFSSLISSYSVGMLYKTLSLFQENKKVCTIVSFIFVFSFSNIIFSSSIELYNIAAFSMICFFYLLACIMKNGITKNTYFYLLVFGVLLVSVTITNYIVFLIGCFILIISRKMKLLKVLALNGFVILCVIILSCFQYLIWHNTPLVFNIFDNVAAESDSEWVNFDIGLSEIKKVGLNDYYHSIIPSDMYIENVGYSRIAFQSFSPVTILFISIFYLCLIYYSLKKIKKNLYLNLFLGLVLLFNTCFHCVYGNDCAFLYSQHFVYLFFLLLGINFENNKKFKLFLIIFFIYELIVNHLMFKKLLHLVGMILNENTIVNSLSSGMIIFILFFVFASVLGLLFWIRHDVKYLICHPRLENNDKIRIVLVLIFKFILIICVFITIQTTAYYHKFLIFDNTNYINSKNSLSNHFSYEYAKLYEYKMEYSSFVSNYNLQVHYDFNDISFYLFGMGNREKYIFYDNKLISLSDRQTIYNWDIVKYEVIPNLYTVVFELNNGEYGKLYENESGIFVEIADNKETINDIDMSFYDFSSYSYPNIMKVLYSELLFNIQDGMFRPNIIVYDEIWYRDAAIGAMVLDEIGQVDLIETGIYKINTIYDKQNGVEEADNLGEVLYLLSLVDNPSQEFIDKIIKEADKTSKNGYIQGITDSMPLYYYQNAWYQYGIKQLGLQTNMKMPDTVDSYTAGAWWYHSYDDKTLIGGGNINYPYLAWAEYHNVNQGNLYCSGSIYPLSYEADASHADYSKLDIIDERLVSRKNSPTHVWTAAEMLLFLLDN